MARAGAKRSKQSSDQSPSTATSASKKRKTDKKKIAPQKVAAAVEKKMDPFLASFCEKFKHPADSVQFLLQNSKMSVDDFFKNHWETKPLAMHAAEPSSELSKIFNLDLLGELVDQSEAEGGSVSLAPDRDYVFSKFVDGKRDDAVVDVVTQETVKKLRQQKYGIQINQPQRFQDALWAIAEKLECHFGSLVSCHVFWLPTDVQMLPPRYEDTEKFVLQLDGSSAWKLHKPKKDYANDFNDCIEPSEMGDEILSAELKAGDVLYFPRGTIFESKGVTDGFHVTFSTFQNLSQASLLLQTIGSVVDEQSTSHPEFRRGLPLGFLPKADSISNAEYADLLVKLAESVRARAKPLPRPEGMIQDFMMYRLPPFGCPKFVLESGVPLTPNMKISFRNKEHITWCVRKYTDSDMNENAVDEEGVVDDDLLGPQKELVVYSSINNDRKSHMTIESRLLGIEADAFSVGVEYEELLETIYKADKPLALKSLTKTLTSGVVVDAMVLARCLYNVGAIDVVE